MNTEKILLVEGETDKKFFQKLFERLNLQVKVEPGFDVSPKTPLDYGEKRDGKASLLDLLNGRLKGLQDGTITHCGVVLDADFEKDGWGAKRTLENIKGKITTLDFSADPIHLDSCGGFIFPHNDGLKPLGVWIMPDNFSEGMMEHMIANAVQQGETQLLQYAGNVVSSLENKKFKTHHLIKAHVSTWLAWQKLPGEGIDSVIKEDLIDYDAPCMKNLCQWLRKIYSAE
jgi:hypothetical protein